MAKLYINNQTSTNDLFETLEILTGASGGDGWGIVISEQYKELADKYDIYRKGEVRNGGSLGKNFVRENYNDDIVFHDQSNENISFVYKLPADMPDWVEAIIYYG